MCCYLQFEAVIVAPGDTQLQGLQLTGCLLRTGGAWLELQAQFRLVEGQQIDLHDILQGGDLRLQPAR